MSGPKVDVLMIYSEAIKLLMCWKNRNSHVYRDQQVYLKKRGYDRIDGFHTECLGLNGEILGLRIQEGVAAPFWFSNCEKVGIKSLKLRN